MSVINGRKVKDWAVFTKLYAMYNGSPVFPGTSYPLKIVVDPPVGTYGQTGYKAEVAVTITGSSWILVDTFESFEMAKAKVREIGGEIGFDNVRILRVVDLNTVLYPIS